MSNIEEVEDNVTVVLTFINHDTGGSHSVVVDVDGYEDSDGESVDSFTYGTISGKPDLRAKISLEVKEND